MHKIQLIAGIKNKKLRQTIAKDLCDDCLYKAIQEVAINTVKGNIKLSAAARKRLKHNKKLILQLSKRQKNHNKQRQLVGQSGGFLQILLPSLIAAIGEVAYGALRKN